MVTHTDSCVIDHAYASAFCLLHAPQSFELWDSPKTVVHVDIVEQRVMSGSLKNHITCNVVADVEDFVGVLLQHLYGFIETRRKTFMSEHCGGGRLKGQKHVPPKKGQR